MPVGSALWGGHYQLRRASTIDSLPSNPQSGSRTLTRRNNTGDAMAIRKSLIVGAMIAALFTGSVELANAADNAPAGYHDSGSAPTGHHEGG
jgi:hypothetical protein